MATTSLVREIFAKLTWEEKVSLLSGADESYTQEISRLGIGAIKIIDGPAGARGSRAGDGSKAALLPAPVLQAATWSRSDLRELGRVLSRETQSKAAQVLLAPTISCHRNPLGGRNFGSFSEDPFLSGRLAIEYVAGLQESGKVVATAKYFVANEVEYHRSSIDTQIEERILREIHLRPFEMLVKSATAPECFMIAWNRTNGLHMDMQKRLIADILHKKRGFQGLVMSNWGGTNSTIQSLLAGCDLQMPGPTWRRGVKLLEVLESIDSDQLRTAIDESCTRLLSLAERLGKLNLSADELATTRHQPELSSTGKEDLIVLRRIAANGMVLLKNESDVLPLDPQSLSGKKITFIGPNAVVGASNGGGSAAVNPAYLTHPFDSFKAALAKMGIHAEVGVALGCRSHKWLPLLSATQWQAPDAPKTGNTMVRIDFFASRDCEGSIVETQYRNSSSIDLFDTGPEVLRNSGKLYSFRMTSILRPTTCGEHTFGISSVGGARLRVDGYMLVNNSNWTGTGETFHSLGSPEIRANLKMSSERTYEVVLEAWSKMSNRDLAEVEPTHIYRAQPSTRLGFMEEERNTIAGAMELANDSDLCVIVIGLNDEWESEGYDRQSMKLPGDQDKLVHTLLTLVRHPERIIIVNQSGSPVEMPWADNAYTILQAWYGGQEAGNALADVLLGVARPKGRLPMTWPKVYSDSPFSAYNESWPRTSDRVWYKEGTKVGYRWYLDTGVTPQWWFGYGLDYTAFKVKSPSIDDNSKRWKISTTIKNVGQRMGDEVVQVYVWPLHQPHAKVLCGFQRTDPIEPGEEQDVHLVVELRDVAGWDDDRWTLKAGLYAIGVGRHAGDRDMMVQGVSVPTTLQWRP